MKDHLKRIEVMRRKEIHAWLHPEATINAGLPISKLSSAFLVGYNICKERDFSLATISHGGGTTNQTFNEFLYSEQS